jgi:proteasome lid subunit RPN8/RPN11
MRASWPAGRRGASALASVAMTNGGAARLLVELAPAMTTTLAALAARAHPREFVGALGGRTTDAGWRVETILPLPNVAGATDAFAIAAHDFAAAAAELAASDTPWIGFVHSHPHGDPRPSARDRAALWRDCLQLIVGGERIAAFVLRGPRVLTLPLAILAAEPR